MTEPVHCDHECVCESARGLIKLGYRNIGAPCDYNEQYPIPCPHDTRARGPVVAQQAPAERNLRRKWVHEREATTGESSKVSG